MIQVLEEPQSFGQAFASNLMGGLSKGFSQEINSKSEREHELKKMSYAQKLKGEEAEKKESAKREEKDQPLLGALQRVKDMKEIRKKGNLGMFSGLTQYLSPETRRDRGAYETMGKSLIQFATNIPIRNKLEFETLSEKLYDPSVTDAEADGILDRLEQIISSGLSPENQSSSQSKQSKKESLEDIWS